jgi:uncharacterized iron-regulated protein
MRLRLAITSLLIAAACASPAATPDLLHSETEILLLGEQHDEPAHHKLERDMVQALASRGVLAALALEMTDRGASTAGIGPDASEATVRQALQWSRSGWPWEAYAPAVMAAVAAGVPVVGANLTRQELRQAAADPSLDRELPGPGMKEQAIRTGHCDLLPETQVEPMARMQVARDRAIAATLQRLVVPGKTVLLIAGAGHADPEIGVPHYLPAGLIVKSALLPPPLTPRTDYCEQLRRQWSRLHGNAPGRSAVSDR